MPRKPNVTDDRIIEFLKLGLNNAAICKEFGKTQEQLNTRINILREKFNKERFSDGADYGKKKAEKFAAENRVQLPEGMKRATAPEPVKAPEICTQKFEDIVREAAMQDAQKFANEVNKIKNKIENLELIPTSFLDDYNYLLMKYKLAGGEKDEKRD